MSGFRWPPIMHIPNARSPAGSFALMIVAAGSMGLSGDICAASFAACSIASISALQPTWSKGQTTIGLRRRMSLAEESLAWEMLVYEVEMKWYVAAPLL